MRLFGRYCYRTRFGLAHVFETHAPDGSPVRVLKVGGVWQSATYLDERRFQPVFEYYRAFDAVFGPEKPANCGQRILMLGGGGFAWPKHVLATRPSARLDVVEVDPAIIRIAYDHFFLDEAIARFDPARRRLNVICADGREYADAVSRDRGKSALGGKRYDAVVNDTFLGDKPIRALATVEALRSTKACLAPGGLYLTNVVSEENGYELRFLRDFVATLLQVFANVHIIPCPDGDFGGEDNYLLAATDKARPFEGAVPFDGDFPGEPMWD